MKEIYLIAIVYSITFLALLSGFAVIYFKIGYHKSKENKKPTEH